MTAPMTSANTSSSALRATLVEDRRLWNEFVAATPSGHLCQTWEWAENSGEEAGSGSLRIGVMDGERLVAAILLVRSRASGTHAPFFYAPRGPVAPIRPRPRCRCSFASPNMRRAATAASSSAPSQTSCRMIRSGQARSSASDSIRPTSHHIYLRSAWVTDLRADEDALLANMMTTWRQNIRAGARKGLTVRLGSGEADLDAFYQLLVETGQRDSFHVYPKAAFPPYVGQLFRRARRTRRHRRDGGAAGRIQWEPIAAATVAILGKWSWNLHSGSSGSPEHRKLRPNYLLQWECMRWVKAHGADYYDWRTIPDVLEPGQELYGVYEFKRGFGGAVRRVIPTQDLVVRPALYWPYYTAVSLRRSMQRRKRAAFERRRERARQATPTKQPGRQPNEATQTARRRRRQRRRINWRIADDKWAQQAASGQSA